MKHQGVTRIFKVVGGWGTANYDQYLSLTDLTNINGF